ncbi:hypothetical protein QE152_g37645 [Popillia japonica]|uniref:Uncharacterized protein n=1 Tax=Popillia japonica TaxID=7064 RepID=A0AAW1I9G7_POPJA
MDTLCYHYNLAFPLTKCKTGTAIKTNSKGWITEQITKSSDDLRDLYLLQKKYPQLKKWYLKKAVEHKQLVKKTKKDYNSRIISSAANKFESDVADGERLQ